MVYKMSLEDPGGVSFAGIGGLGEQVRELREVGSRSLLPRGTPLMKSSPGY
jgi:26S proteasome regulatory subunit T4